MLIQVVAVAVIVAACAVSATWNLMPAAARRGCARAALRLPWPAPLAARWQRAASESSGCGGCKHTSAGHGAASIHIVRKAGSSKRG